MSGSRNGKKNGRNDPCPCGSGKKFKKCCGSAQIEAAKVAMNKKSENQPEWEAKFGKLRRTVSWDFAGYKMVGIGNRVQWSKRAKTFASSLMEYIAMTLGGEWGNNEIKKPFADRHQILQWYHRLCEFQHTLKQGHNGMIDGDPNGITKAYMLLAFDLYALRHHLALQKKMVKRLKDKANFQGARHELFVAATFIKAGFDIDYEDESDSSRKHPEFIAKHRETGQQVSVEAKSRHRPGILGFAGCPSIQEPKAGIKGLIDSALAKPAAFPYVIFIDVNLPPSSKPVFETSWFKEVAESATKAGHVTETDPSPFNQLVFTNHPFHYAKDNEPCPQPAAFSAVATNPKIAIAHPSVLMAIHDTVYKFGNIPENFE